MTKTAVLIGAGDRGTIYSNYALKHPDKLKIIGVAEPSEERRKQVVSLHQIDKKGIFQSYQDFFKATFKADAVIIATQDTMHVEPAMMAFEKGYHVLLEKPMALTEEDCKRIVSSAGSSGTILNVCHVLRYTGFFKKIKQIIDQGIIGEIYSIYHAENVSYHHMAHSFVRGNWGNSQQSSPMILAKCCHDMDLIQWLAGSRPQKISSFGTLSHFKKENAPKHAPIRCTDGCDDASTCQYNAVDCYLHGRHIKNALAKSDSTLVSNAAKLMLRFPRLSGFIPGLKQYGIWKEWPTKTITEDLSETGILKALTEGPYGRCVYHCDNDQVDHQETIIEFEDGKTAVLKMHGHSYLECRTLRIDGSLGTLRGRFGAGGLLEVELHGKTKPVKYPVKTDLFGHEEGDYGVMDNFVSALNGGRPETDAKESLLSHMMAFAADSSRRNSKVETIPIL